MNYYRSVVCIVFPIFCILFICDYYVNLFIPESFVGLLVFVLLSVLISVLSIILLGISSQERIFIFNMLKSKFKMVKS